MFTLPRSNCAVVFVLFWAVPIFAQDLKTSQEIESLRAELLRVEQEHTRKLAALEAKIAQLETELSSQKEQTKSTASAIQALTTEVTGTLAEAGQQAKQVGAAPLYEQLRDADQKIGALEEHQKAFEFHGYLRSGYGLNGEGGVQVPFQAPGADAKFRLGNETETFVPLTFVYNILNPSHGSGSPWLKVNASLELTSPYSQDYTAKDLVAFRESYVQAGALFKSQPGLSFWAGQRRYRRYHFDINDFYPLDMSGVGGGFEDLNLGPAKLAIAYVANVRSDIVTTSGNLTKSNIDTRLYDIKVPGGRLGVWFDFATAKGGTKPDGTPVPTTNGYAFSIRHQRLEWMGGFNSFTVMYGKGAASTFNSSIPDPTAFTQKADRFLVVEAMLIQPNKRFGVLPEVLYQRRRDGNPKEGTDEWLALGVRPIIYFTDHLSLAFESGFDHTTSGSGKFDGWLSKYTIMPQIGVNRHFFGPVFRVYATYATWSNGFRGLVGGAPYANATSGFAYGVQAETSW